MSQKLAQMTTENGGADGLALCDWAPGPLSLTRSVFSPSLPDWGTTEPKGRSKLAAAAGGFGLGRLGWAGLGCAYHPLIACLVGRPQLGSCALEGKMLPACSGCLPGRFLLQEISSLDLD